MGHFSRAIVNLATKGRMNEKLVTVHARVGALGGSFTNRPTGSFFGTFGSAQQLLSSIPVWLNLFETPHKQSTLRLPQVSPDRITPRCYYPP